MPRTARWPPVSDSQSRGESSRLASCCAASELLASLRLRSSGAMCYMLSKQGYLSDRDGHWHPHLMFFFSQTDPAALGANLPGSPIIAFNDTWQHLTMSSASSSANTRAGSPALTMSAVSSTLRAH
jgi:hypothetical protein